MNVDDDEENVNEEIILQDIEHDNNDDLNGVYIYIYIYIYIHKIEIIL